MIKQLFANGKSSYNDFKIYIKERNPSIPTKRKNIKTVPGMHGAYDFSDLYGEVIYENRTIEYKFDVTGWDIEDLDYERRRVMDWLLNINQTEIIDEYSPHYHWYGSYSEGSWKEDAEQGTLTVKFNVYPFAISNNPIEVNFKSTIEEQEIKIDNTSSHRVVPKIITDGNILIKKDGKSVSLSAGEWEVDNLYFEKGENTLLVSGSANVCVKFYEEVF
uniref:Distal tail protein n=1 Tax=Siphoviridae sp. ctUse40 TaxID=2826356 RepID=A0A8S5NDM0_9CAUD|nr:MAG TPA: distal tail protein [Siphoviridae sp. ctUse40]